MQKIYVSLITLACSGTYIARVGCYQVLLDHMLGKMTEQAVNGRCVEPRQQQQ